MNRLFALSCCSALLLGAFAQPSLAADPVLVQGEKFSITTLDMQADSLRMPPEMRGVVLAQPNTVAQVASNLYVRRAFAEKAEAEGLGADPIVAAALRIARDKVLSDALIAKLDERNAPTDDKLEGMARSMYNAKPERFKSQDQVQIRHILIAISDAGGQQKAEKLLTELKGGADFAKLAKENSADPGSAANGGDLGFFTKGRMVPEFETAAFALKNVGDLSGIVKTQFGYHILQLEATKPAGVRPFEEVRAEIVKEVRDGVLQDARVAEAQKIQQRAKIDEQAVKSFADSQKGTIPIKGQTF